MTQITPQPDLTTKFATDGYVIARNVIDPDLVKELVAHVEWLQRKYPDVRPEQFGGNTLDLRHDPFWVRLVSDDRLLDVAQQFVGPNIGLFASHYIAKPPFDGQPVLWHQDGSFWPLEPMEVVTLWLAVDDVDAENGCMEVIPQTQHLDLQKLQVRKDVENALGASMDETMVDESRAVDIVLKAGDLSIHHPNVIHGSKPNTSSRWRRGLTIRYIPSSTRIISDQPWDMALHLRGTEVPGVNIYQPWPMYLEGRDMPFRGTEEWNQRATAWNSRTQ
jgi:phytanoyl-CoA hydroxylase